MLPEGFAAAGVAAGIKPEGLDLALVAADAPVATAAVFTSSAAAAAPVRLSKQHVAQGRIRAVIANSGCANAATGAAGDEHALRMASAVATALGSAREHVLVCSTGVIGVPLPIDSIEEAVPALVGRLDPGSMPEAARAIMTTDSAAKIAERRGACHLVGIAKGAGMIRPDMATMLSIVATDAAVAADHLKGALRRAVDVSFNAVSVDGCMSTNDTVVVMASGRRPVRLEEFEAHLTSLCIDLARQIAADGEGSTRQVTITVRGAASDSAARAAGLAVADSALVRSSFAASDPNWGRIVAALGASGIPTDGVAVRYGDITVAQGGVAVAFDGDAVRAVMAGDFEVEIDLGAASGIASVFTCDLTPAYVVENMETS